MRGSGFYVDATVMLWGGVGWGGVGCNNVHVTCVEVDATLMLRCCYGDVLCWGGVGWGAITFMYSNLRGSGCYVDATLRLR